MDGKSKRMWWHPQNFDKRRPMLLARGAVIKGIRRFFDDQGFFEVETPILQVCPVIDAHIRAFSTDLKGSDGAVTRNLYLHTSPEFAMKKLMVAGVERQYQICKVFRNGEDTGRHSPEFTMIEWYRTHQTYLSLMEDCEGVLRAAAVAADVGTFRYKDGVCDPFLPFERISVRDAFMRHAGFDLAEYLNDATRFNDKVRGLGIRTAEDDGWDDLFFRVMGERIEPYLGFKRPTILYDYPLSMASLSRKKFKDPRFAERFELYVCGLELANGFSELTDADEQTRRYHEEMAIKNRLYGEIYPLDDDFIAAIAYGMPESAGIALGIDRLVMLATGADTIEEVLWCGKP